MKKKQPLRETLIWQRAKGKEVLLCEMSKRHIQDAVMIIARKQELCDGLGLGDYEVQGGTNANYWIGIFKEELLYRDKNNITVKEEYE
jgi:hypothetical protein